MSGRLAPCSTKCLRGGARSRVKPYRTRWGADGKEIFYLSPEGALMAVPVESGENAFRTGTARELFRTREASFSTWPPTVTRPAAVCCYRPNRSAQNAINLAASA
jgi:hypothetical protein